MSIRFETFAMISVDCIDCAADESVVNAVNEGINVALSIARVRRPWVMISVNDDREDLHFRKAGEFTVLINPNFICLICLYLCWLYFSCLGHNWKS